MRNGGNEIIFKQPLYANNRPNQNEIFLSLFKRVHGPVINDVVVIGVVLAGLTKKYQYHLDSEAFNTISDELVEAGLFRWNDTTKSVDSFYCIRCLLILAGQDF